MEIFDLDAFDKASELLTLDSIVPRNQTILCPISDSELMIGGGVFKDDDA